MALSLAALDPIAIHNPCTVPWDEMQGSNPIRFRINCSKNVHDSRKWTSTATCHVFGRLCSLNLHGSCGRTS